MELSNRCSSGKLPHVSPDDLSYALRVSSATLALGSKPVVQPKLAIELGLLSPTALAFRRGQLCRQLEQTGFARRMDVGHRVLFCALTLPGRVEPVLPAIYSGSIRRR